MLIAKLNGQPFQTELPYSAQSEQVAAPPLAALASSKVAIITTAGVVPAGNPDRFFLRGNTFWRKYPIDELERLDSGAWIAVHGGYSTSWMNQNPKPGRAARCVASLGKPRCRRPGRALVLFHPGVGAEFDQASRMGREIAADLKAQGIDAALLVST
jgi:glycine reductase